MRADKVIKSFNSGLRQFKWSPIIKDSSRGVLAYLPKHTSAETNARLLTKIPKLSHVLGVESNLRGVDLSNRAFRKVNLQGANLTDANLSGTFIKHGNLTGAHLNRANLANVEFGRVNLTGADLRYANLTGAELMWASLERAKLKQANLEGADFLQANLTGAKLNRANLGRASLKQANLEGADLRKAELAGADLTEASLKQTNLTGANLGRASLKQANLEGANLRKAELAGADLTETSLKQANLTGANFTGAYFNHTNLQQAKFNGADLTNATIQDSILEGTSFKNAKLHNTAWMGNTLNSVVWDGSNISGARAILNQGSLPSGVHLLPDLFGYRRRTYPPLTTAEETQELNRLAALAREAGIPTLIKHGLENSTDGVTIQLNTHHTTHLDPLAVKLLMLHEQGHKELDNIGYKPVSDANFAREVVGFMTPDANTLRTNHNSEYDADAYAARRAVQLGYPPSQILQAYRRLRQSYYDNPRRGRTLSTAISPTHPSHRDRHWAIVNTLRNLKSQQRASKTS
ncbi:MAG: pentapeptide repeat-containing protein [Vampirovibrionales bacterium]